ncbi:MAG: hypothetical protein ACRC7N_05045 [Clostridium sp.]
MDNILKLPLNIFSKIIDIFVKEEAIDDNIFEITLPNNVLHRTELICNYISSEYGHDFSLDNFLMLLYLDFIKSSITNYNPKKIYAKLTTEYYKKKTLILESGDEKYEVVLNGDDFTTLTISIEEEDKEKGMLILEELYDLYRIRISFNRLLEALWIDFIEGYKKGENTKAFKTIVNLLENCFKK